MSTARGERESDGLRRTAYLAAIVALLVSAFVMQTLPVELGRWSLLGQLAVALAVVGLLTIWLNPRAKEPSGTKVP